VIEKRCEQGYLLFLGFKNKNIYDSYHYYKDAPIYSTSNQD